MSLSAYVPCDAIETVKWDVSVATGWQPPELIRALERLGLVCAEGSCAYEATVDSKEAALRLAYEALVIYARSEMDELYDENENPK